MRKVNATGRPMNISTNSPPMMTRNASYHSIAARPGARIRP